MVVPQLGAFLVKEPGHIVLFSQLLTKDDGILRDLLIQDGVGEIEANGIIQRMVFDVRYIIDNGGEFTMHGVGRFTQGEAGALLFESIPEPAAAQNAEYLAEVPLDAEESESMADQVGQDELGYIDGLESGEEPAEESAEEQDLDANDTIPANPSRGRFQSDPDLKGLSYGGVGKSKIDWWLVIGIAAVALALGVILYGFLRAGARSGYPMAQVEQVAAE